MKMRALLVLAALLLCGLRPGAVYAAVAADSFPAGAIDNNYPVNPGTTRVIDQYGTCRVVTNNTQNALYVPLASAAEWNGPDGIIAHPPRGITISQCYRCTVTYTGPNMVETCGTQPVLVNWNGAIMTLNYAYLVPTYASYIYGNACIYNNQPYAFTVPAAYDNMTVTLASSGAGGGGYANYTQQTDSWNPQCSKFGDCCTITTPVAGINGDAGNSSKFGSLTTPTVAGAGGGGCAALAPNPPANGICVAPADASSGPNGPNGAYGVNPLVTSGSSGTGPAGGAGGSGCITSGGCGSSSTYCSNGSAGSAGNVVQHSYSSNDHDLGAGNAGPSPAFGSIISVMIGAGGCGGSGGNGAGYAGNGTNGNGTITFSAATPYTGASCIPMP